ALIGRLNYILGVNLVLQSRVQMNAGQTDQPSAEVFECRGGIDIGRESGGGGEGVGRQGRFYSAPSPQSEQIHSRFFGRSFAPAGLHHCSRIRRLRQGSKAPRALPARFDRAKRNSINRNLAAISLYRTSTEEGSRMSRRTWKQWFSGIVG